VNSKLTPQKRANCRKPDKSLYRTCQKKKEEHLKRRFPTGGLFRLLVVTVGKSSDTGGFHEGQGEGGGEPKKSSPKKKPEGQGVPPTSWKLAKEVRRRRGKRERGRSSNS